MRGSTAHPRFTEQQRTPTLHTMSQTINLVSQEGDKFEVSREVAMMSNLVKEMIGEEDADEDEQEIPLPNVKNSVLAKVRRASYMFVYRAARAHGAAPGRLPFYSPCSPPPCATRKHSRGDSARHACARARTHRKKKSSTGQSRD